MSLSVHGTVCGIIETQKPDLVILN
uniref:Uncharacterized protein n=1 Tax=Anguilla anguilla TaxID=7936 RepID=A0A0E9PC90_ANGAN